MQPPAINPKRILILTADAGFGHRSAANAVALALQELHGSECLVEVVNPLDDPRVPGMLRRSQRDYDRWMRDAPGVYNLGYQASDNTVPSSMAESAMTLMLFDVMRDLVEQHSPNAIVTTYPLYQDPLKTVFALNKIDIPVITIVTDLGAIHRLWFHEVADLCLVPTQTTGDLARAYGIAAERIRVTGIPANPALAAPIADRSALRASLGWQADPITLLAVGSQRVQHLPTTLGVLNHSGLPLQLIAVAGGNTEAYAQLMETDWHVPAHVYNYVQDMPNMLRAADCILCKAGGLILTEALACGLPILLVSVLPGQEMGNAAYVLSGGAAEQAHNPLEVLEILCHWLQGGGKLLRERAACARALGRPRAAYDAAELVWAEALRCPSKPESPRPSTMRQIRRWLGRRAPRAGDKRDQAPS
jgi:1,2-diacylglycerol 3-beta-galactosyltransferase